MAAQARPTSAKQTNIIALIDLNVLVRINPMKNIEASNMIPPMMVFFLPIFEAMLPIGI